MIIPYIIPNDGTLPINHDEDEIVIPKYNNDNSQRNTNITDKFYIVTYASNKYFDRVANLIGSIHFWMPTMKIVFYDIGLNKDERNKIHKICNVIYERFPFEDYPLFIKQNLKYYAWQPIILSLSVQKYHNILMQDAGQELRQNIHALLNNIWKIGYFFTKIPVHFTFIHKDTEIYLNITQKYMFHFQGGIVGMSLDGMIKNITKMQIEIFLNDYVQCAMVKQCIAPKGSSIKNHRYSQAAQTLLIQNINWTEGITSNISYCEWEANKLTKDETDSNNVILFSRRGMLPKPYRKYLLQNCTKNTSSVYI